jgi:3,4-dihydroxy 2-butanone 4-phosphate synthase
MHIRYLRQVAGGVIFLAIGPDLAEKVRLPFMADILTTASVQTPLLAKLKANDLKYDRDSAFSISINHRQTFTGVTDFDRAKTVSCLGNLAPELQHLNSEDAQILFGENFRSPGHIPLCLAARGLLSERQGHTELAIALAKVAGESYAVVLGCEMLSNTGHALDRLEAKKWAETQNISLVSGEDLLHAL